MERKMEQFSDFIPSGNDEIDSLLKFTIEIDKMTAIMRRTLLIDGSRRENDAEHSWHIAVMALIFRRYADKQVDIERVIKMCIVHDLIEIYAGDTFAYDIEGNKDKEERERQAADKLFGSIPDDVGSEIRALWEEFDAMETKDSLYASCMDRLQPFLHNTLTGGHTWDKYGAMEWQIRERVATVIQVIPELTDWIEANIQRGKERGWIKG